MKMQRIRLKNGMLLDGCGTPAVRGELLLEGERIVAMGDQVPAGDVDLDVGGSWLAPGFIDVHTHTDLAPFAAHGLEPKLLQGVTTEICGQCGLSVAPMPHNRQPGWRKQMVIGDVPGEWAWSSFAEYLQALQAQPLDCNMVPFVGHGTLRWAVRGAKPGSLDAHERDELAGLARDSFAAGAAGLSLGLIYLPALFADRQELLTVMREAGRAGVPVAVHLRSESDELDSALQEMIDLAREAECQLHHSHLKCIGFSNRPLLDKTLALLEEHHIAFDSYPYASGSTTLASLLPPWLMNEGLEGAIEQLQQPAAFAELQALYAGTAAQPEGVPWDNLSRLLGWDNIWLAAPPEGLESLAGSSMAEIAAEQQQDAAAVLIDLLRQGGTAVRMLDRYMSEEALKTILTHPLGMTGSDTLLGGKPHPRVYGTYPRLIGTYALEKKWLSLEDAVARCTGRSAQEFRLKNRGVLREGAVADLVVFDKTYREQGTFQQPDRSPSGMQYVFVNGRMRVENGTLVGSASGCVLKGGE